MKTLEVVFVLDVAEDWFCVKAPFLSFFNTFF